MPAPPVSGVTMSCNRARLATALAVLLVGCDAPLPRTGEASRVLLATTTSTANSGLLDHLLPIFQRQTGIRVDAVAVGTGAALRLAERGDADLVLVHDPRAEEAFVARGSGEARIPLMRNDFVLVGPATDPASVEACGGTIEAFRRIARRGSPFVSRGDSSGTHARELSLWRLAGVLRPGAWCLEAGQGMAGCLTLADEMSAYALTDRATFLALADRLQLRPLVQGDSLLANPYSLILVDPRLRAGGNHAGARRLVEWLTSLEGRRRIADFRARGEMLFVPEGGPPG